MDCAILRDVPPESSEYTSNYGNYRVSFTIRAGVVQQELGPASTIALRCLTGTVNKGF